MKWERTITETFISIQTHNTSKVDISASPIQLKGIKKVGGWKRIKKIKD